MKHVCITWIQDKNCVLFNWSKSSLLIDKFAVKRTVQKEFNRKSELEGSTNEQYTHNLKPSFVFNSSVGLLGSFFFIYKPCYITALL